MISNRHIRHDWQTFVEWNQKSVRTLCGQKSQPRLCGIPGVTDCPVDTWCPNCIHRAIVGSPRKSHPIVKIMADLRVSSDDRRVEPLYDSFFRVITFAARIKDQ